MIVCLYDTLKNITWPILKIDTVLNVWIMRTGPKVSEHSLKCDWPLITCNAQGDADSEPILKEPIIQQKIRKCIPSDVSGVSFRIKLLAGGILDKDPIFHVTKYQWKQS